MSFGTVPDHAFAPTKRSGAVMPDGDALLLLRLFAYSDHPDTRAALGVALGLEGPYPAFACPSHQTLSRDLQCSERTTYDRIARLTAAGWICRAYGWVKGRKLLGWKLATATRFEASADDTPCELPQVTLRETTADPAVRRRVNEPAELRWPAGYPAAARRVPCGPPQTDPLTTTATTGGAEVVVLATAKREQVEREVLAAMAEVKPSGAGMGFGPSFVSPPVERILAGEATIADVRAVLVEWNRRKASGDQGLGSSPMTLFFAGKAWERTQRSYLLRAPAGGRRRRSSTAGLAGLSEHWSDRAAVVDVEPTPEQLARDEADADAAMGIRRGSR